jgi:hypothetical protein
MARKLQTAPPVFLLLLLAVGAAPCSGWSSGPVPSVPAALHSPPPGMRTCQVQAADVTGGGPPGSGDGEKSAAGGVAQPSTADRGAPFLRVEISTREVYVGEQAIYTVKLYRRARVSDLTLNLPESPHFTFRQIGKPAEYQALYRGESYTVLALRYALFAAREGVHTVGPLRLTFTAFGSAGAPPVASSGEAPSADPFFGLPGGQAVSLTSEPLELEVLPLPAAGRPGDFGGLVGTFKIESRLEPATIRTGEASTFTAVVQGVGNFDRLPDLKLPRLGQVKAYAGEPSLKIEPEAAGLAATKTATWALVPEREGVFRVPRLRVSFFDSVNRCYRVIETLPRSLTVLRGEGPAASASGGPTDQSVTEASSRRKVREIGQDILPIHTSLRDLAPDFPGKPGGPLLFATLLAPPLAFLVAVAAIRLRRRMAPASPAARAKRAAGALLRELRRGRPGARHLEQAVRTYLNDRFLLSCGAFTPEEGARLLRARGASPETAQRFQAFLGELEAVIYTGRGEEPCEPAVDLARTIEQIEKEVR